ncbi:MAG: hypothetical protein KAJ60_11580, partial [Desulfobulbaceae bacterium]|nr:hypothetical protein [Desulfobulbaceae bacterium]
MTLVFFQTRVNTFCFKKFLKTVTGAEQTQAKNNYSAKLKRLAKFPSCNYSDVPQIRSLRLPGQAGL